MKYEANFDTYPTAEEKKLDKYESLGALFGIGLASLYTLCSAFVSSSLMHHRHTCII
jgi:hypothetical protein